MPVALTRAIRFAAGTVVRFTPAVNATLLEMLQSARPQVGEMVAAAQAARITIESLEDNACRIRVAQFDLDLAPANADGYTLRVAWADPATGAQRTVQLDGIAPMLGGRGDVFFAQRSGGENRLWLKLSYESGGAALYAFPAAFAERLPAAVRALLPAQLALGTLSAG